MEERRLVGVKMAVEINKFHHISVPTEDFSIPSVEDMQLGLMEAYDYMAKGNDLYVGCMGGIGRTGLFMGCIAKLMQDCGNVGFQKSLNTGDPVRWVRENYKHDVSARVYGGRFKDYDKEERRLVGVKMAVEINKFHHISVPTEDFSIPSVEDMQSGLMEAYDYMAKGNDLYVGCMGGIVFAPNESCFFFSKLY